MGLELNIEQWPVTRLRPYENSPRKNDLLIKKISKTLLTAFATLCRLYFPNQKRRSRRLLAVPAAGEVRSFLFLPSNRPFWAWMHIGGATSSIREDWRPLLSRGALFRFFAFKNPKSKEVFHGMQITTNNRAESA